MTVKKYIWGVCLTVATGLLSIPVAGQDFNPYELYGSQNVRQDPVRSILNQFSFSFSAGYGRTFYSQKLNGYGIINNNDSIYIYGYDKDNPSPTDIGYRQWLTNTRIDSIQRDIPDELGENVKFKGNSAAIPFTLMIHYNFLERFRIGGGISYEIHYIPTMNPTIGQEVLGTYIPDISKAHLWRYFGMIGGKIYQIQKWSYFADIRIGKTVMGGVFDKSAVKPSVFFNIGFPMEYEFSEYLKAYIRPAVEFKNYQMDLGGLSAIITQQPAVFVQFGFRYNIPEIPRCPLKAKNPTDYDYPKRFTNKTCRIQKKHIHGDKMYRGQPFYKEQNPKVGQNYPILHKYRLFNRRKMGGGY